METGDKIELNIVDLSSDGRGIGKTDGLAVFVSSQETPRPMPGDTIAAEITRKSRRYADAKMLKFIAESPDRAAPFCGQAGLCGGCPLQEMRYGAQLLLKGKQLKDKLERIAGLQNPDVLPVLGMDEPLRFRNKAKMPVSPDGAGFYHAKSHKVVDCLTCPVSAPPAEVLLGALRGFMKEYRVPAYDAATDKGLIHRLTVRTAEYTGEVMAVVAASGGSIPNYRKLIEIMDNAVEGIPDGAYSLESVFLNSTLLAGKPTITDQISALNLEISPSSFYQVNTKMTRHLYDLVLRYAGLNGNETVLDICCGVGAIGLLCAANSHEVIGIESEKETVNDANRNAVINGITNIRFIRGKAEEQLPALLESGHKADVAILDPPRAGCKPELLKAVASANPKRVVYVSCDPATLARDVKILSGLGYTFREASSVDMFPHTMHLEVVALLQRPDIL